MSDWPQTAGDMGRDGMQREIARLSEALSAKLRQYDADMQTMQKSLNTEIEARQAADAEIEQLCARNDQLLGAMKAALKECDWRETRSFHIGTILRAAIVKAEDANLPTAEDVRGILKAEGK